jgi:sulfatase maturation enzyme AslB (radical SAM superfamily)|tara:strand:- start:3459 stop:4361 length:903 start_codon:yes stop_codon:yes gene_type:complete
MNLSINPTYYCNFRCNFCYLTDAQLADRNKISPEKLNETMSKITDTIDHVDLYGGEISLLTSEYFYSIKEVIRKYYDGPININTNFSALPDYFYDEDITISVSYDFSAREKEQFVLNNIMSSQKPLSVLILASEKVLATDVEFMIFTLNMCSQVKSVEIKPYSTNQANAHPVTHRDFEEFVKKWIDSTTEKKFQFINQDLIEDALDGKYSAFSDDHVYITPTGKFGVLEFDKYDREYFKEYVTYEEYKSWAALEPVNNVSDICKSCKYYGGCLTEHYRYVKDLDNGCNGYKGLLDWYGGI